jgi:CO/xanthine dehydrogenase Mo-binding subunit
VAASILADKPRHKALLEAVAELSGGWKRGPFTAADGGKRARGVAMASPFGSEVATIAEVSIKDGAIVVHDVWVAIDPGRIVNPAIIEAQVNSAVALGLSSALLEKSSMWTVCPGRATSTITQFYPRAGCRVCMSASSRVARRWAALASRASLACRQPW